ncbi:abortive infection system antitoxin AbiGi family protein [Leucothrix pacifica]|uniref:Uncharacterized protein n=1 Tax=Leucothrix pacifica TaxID=1247513 RepID=A0A317C9N9_9GAMM|nr:abortive infection system antitoxin AbiGi family protein [Leucothrix pacifica]PWQ95415.1 hypothetical protein DKW60_15160 [Leucothrix pacifica]
MRPRSNSLFHFTKNEEILFDIMKNGFWPRYCLEDIQWQGGKDFVAFPMVCFCDIPLARINDHVDSYGSYGIGLSKAWAEKNNLNPLIYISSGSALSSCVKRIFKHTKNTKAEENTPADDSRYLIAHSKPTVGKMIQEGVPVEKDFYQESEWRFVPSHDEVTNYLRRDQFEEKNILEEKHAKTREFSSLKFVPSDVSYVFVPKDSDIPNIINFMQNQLDHYPSADLKILFSRVISLESIRRDM